VNSTQGLWILANREDPPEDRIYRLDPGTGDVLGQRILPGSGYDSFGMVEAGAYLWTFNLEDGAILRAGSTTLDATPIEEGSEPNEVASSTDSVWVSDLGADEIIRFDLSGHVIRRVDGHGALARSAGWRLGARSR
jgi:hypothetical protein